MPRSLVALFLSSNRRCGWPLALALLTWAGLTLDYASAIHVKFDYRFDATGYFGTAAAPTPARTALEFAARAFEPFTDNLAAIQPGGGDSWTAKFYDPTSPQLIEVANLPVGENDLVVFALSRDLPGVTLGEASPGVSSLGANPSPEFFNAVVNRGQGAANFDFAPWGGVIRFDTHDVNGVARPWHYDLASGPTFPAFDFYSAAVHELAHIFGFGLSSAFSEDVKVSYIEGVNHRDFIGALATALYGGPIPLISDGWHWGNAVTSPPFATNEPRPALARSQSAGVRRSMTPLDYAALADIGWEAPSKLLGLPGDVDQDGFVDGSDLLAWQQSLGGFDAGGDANGDQLVDNVDGWIIKRFLGAAHANTLPPQGAAVPEPGGAVLAVISLAALAGACRWS